MATVRHNPRLHRMRVVLWATSLAIATVLISSREPTSASVELVPVAPKASVRVGGESADRLAWVVALADPVVAEGTLACVDAGASCGPDEMLAADTTALRAAALAVALADAVNPEGTGYLGNQSEATLRRVTRTAAAANSLAGELRRWLDGGCGSTIDGVPVTTDRPAHCEGSAPSVGAATDSLLRELRSWPDP